MTPAEIIYHRRLAVLEHAGRDRQRERGRAGPSGCLAPATTSGSAWPSATASTALMPKARRAPAAAQRHADPCGRAAAHPGRARADPGRPPPSRPPRRPGAGRSPRRPRRSTWSTHGLGTRRQRVARAAASRRPGGAGRPRPPGRPSPWGSAWPRRPGRAGQPGQLLHRQAQRRGRVYQLTAVDVFTRWAVVAIIVGTPTGAPHRRFVDQVVRHWRRHGYQLRAVITDNGPEYIATGFQAPLAAKELRHVRIPARSPNHNAVVRTLPRHHPPRMLAAGLPPPAFHQPPPTPSRRRRLADHLQPPAPQPQRLHARPDPP